MPNNPAKYEVLIKQYLRTILDISVIGDRKAGLSHKSQLTRIATL